MSREHSRLKGFLFFLVGLEGQAGWLLGEDSCHSLVSSHGATPLTTHPLHCVVHNKSSVAGWGIGPWTTQTSTVVCWVMTALSATTSSSSPGYVQYHSGHRQSRMINGHQHTADVDECSVFSAVFTASVQKSCPSSLPAKTGALLLLPEPVNKHFATSLRTLLQSGVFELRHTEM